MTTYVYMTEMAEMCYRISQACKVMEKTGTQDVYTACSKGFLEMAAGLTFEEAGCTINQDQLDTYVCTQNFCKEQEQAAAAFIKNHLNDLFAEKQPAENYIDKVFTDKKFLQSVAAEAKAQEEDQGYKDWKEMLDDNQAAEDKMEAMLHQDPKGGEKKVLF